MPSQEELDQIVAKLNVEIILSTEASRSNKTSI